MSPALKVALFVLIVTVDLISMPFLILAGNGSAPRTYGMTITLTGACIAAMAAVDSL